MQFVKNSTNFNEGNYGTHYHNANTAGEVGDWKARTEHNSTLHSVQATLNSNSILTSF